MATLEIPAVSTEYLHVQVTADVTLNAQPVEFAFLQNTSPDDTTTWVAGAWEGSASMTRSAKVLLGPGGTVLTAGIWSAWVRVTDSPEIPVRLAGNFRII